MTHTPKSIYLPPLRPAATLGPDKAILGFQLAQPGVGLRIER